MERIKGYHASYGHNLINDLFMIKDAIVAAARGDYEAALDAIEMMYGFLCVIPNEAEKWLEANNIDIEKALKGLEELRGTIMKKAGVSVHEKQAMFLSQAVPCLRNLLRSLKRALDETGALTVETSLPIAREEE